MIENNYPFQQALSIENHKKTKTIIILFFKKIKKIQHKSRKKNN